LLADDMGLGKTYQALAFLAWLKEQMNDGVIPQKPLLVVAPVGLLANWEKEQGLHLRHEGIGEPLRAYGSWLKLLKRGSHMGGDATLDTVQMSRAPWILANYEAISDYQLSFGAIQFGAVIFDEAQKIKSPSTAMTSAAKALNADFVVAMTGTPVENRLADLWCITDTCQPFALKDLKSFSQRFETNPTPETLKTLRDHLWQKESEVGVSEPLMLLRRLKTEKLKGLPEKKEHTVQQNMPVRQLEAYRQAISLNDIRGPQGTLGLIQSLRQISLHPGLFDGQGFDPADSARFAATLDILDRVSKQGEKVLIFIESLEIQAANQLPLLLQRRYQLKELPMVINGSIGTKERQKRVDAFQENRQGFDVMLLSPKAGGVGLTLTAANHVIHLSRWWNPAVEDQCSDRAHRIGQTKNVHIYYPVAIFPEDPERSFDLKLNELMSRKRELSKSMLMPMEFGKDDYDALLIAVGKT
jgi:SNF2 family DNA or RNA helicase